MKNKIPSNGHGGGQNCLIQTMVWETGMGGVMLAYRSSYRNTSGTIKT
jgi:hypothetical protein